MIVQGDQVSNVDPDDADAYYPISKVSQGGAAVLVGNRHTAVRLSELTEVTRVGSTGYYRWNKRSVQPVEEKPQLSFKVEFRVDGWSSVKKVDAINEQKARASAIALLARDLNRTIPVTAAMVKRGQNKVIIKQINQ